MDQQHERSAMPEARPEKGMSQERFGFVTRSDPVKVGHGAVA